MNLKTHLGQKVVFDFPTAGFDDDIERANKYLKIGEVYTVKHIDVEDWVSYVTLEEIGEEVSFNTVQFSNYIDNTQCRVIPFNKLKKKRKKG